MNIGSINRNATGHLIGKIKTLAGSITVALSPVVSANPKAPKYEIMGLSAARDWVKVGALFEQASKADGLVFYTGSIDDPSLASTLYVSLFHQEDGSLNVVWSRPKARRGELTSEMTIADDALPPLPSGTDTGTGAPTEEGLGASTATDAFAS